MSKLCAPVRDDEIAELRQIKEVVPLFQGIMKTMENMKVDMANFMVQQVQITDTVAFPVDEVSYCTHLG